MPSLIKPLGWKPYGHVQMIVDENLKANDTLKENAKR
jgi:phage tail protein X